VLRNFVPDMPRKLSVSRPRKPLRFSLAQKCGALRGAVSSEMKFLTASGM